MIQMKAQEDVQIKALKDSQIQKVNEKSKKIIEKNPEIQNLKVHERLLQVPNFGKRRRSISKQEERKDSKIRNPVEQVKYFDNLSKPRSIKREN